MLINGIINLMPTKQQIIRTIKCKSDDDINEYIDDIDEYIKKCKYDAFTEICDALFSVDKPLMCESFFTALLNALMFNKRVMHKSFYMINQSIKHNKSLYSKYITDLLYENSFEADNLNPIIGYLYNIANCEYNEEYKDMGDEEDDPMSDYTIYIINKYNKLWI